MDIRTRQQLIERVSSGAHVEYVHFWGHRPGANGAIANSCFSQWFAAPFTADDAVYLTAEHYMMAKKAELFGQPELALKILSVEDPGRAKSLGRTVARFDEGIWLKQRWGIVVQGNRLKFSQNPRLRKHLLSTGEKILVEASPLDQIWGIGLDANAPGACTPSEWQGDNLLGFALMEVRALLRDAAVKPLDGSKE